MCAASTRWVQYAIDAVGEGSDGGNGGEGTRGVSHATASVGDTFSIGPTTNRLHFNFGTDSGYITLASGTNLDARFVAKDISQKLHQWAIDNTGSEETQRAICEWINDDANGNHFALYSGELGAGSQIVVSSGVNSAITVLGWSTKSEVGGADTNLIGGAYGGDDISVSGTYYGFLDEFYRILITNDNDEIRGIGTPSKDGSNTYAGTISTGGVYNHDGDLVYTIAIDTTNGTTMGAGTGNVPTMSWTTAGAGTADPSTQAVELLYPDHWYNLGTKGVMVKFTDAVFNTASPAWTISCHKPDFAQGSNASAPPGTAQFAWSSNRGDMSSSVGTTSSGGYVQLGRRGLYIKWNGSSNLSAGDEYYVVCSAPQPSTYDITSLNYGNVTVSTESAVKVVNFEIESGATQMSTVKFGLQNNGTFSHHNEGNGDTKFRFGTVGPGNNNGTGTYTMIEWYPNITAADIDSDVPPTYLYATEDNLSVVSTADSSESVGNAGLMADPTWLNILLGAAETGANSTINYRLYFDYS